MFRSLWGQGYRDAAGGPGRTVRAFRPGYPRPVPEPCPGGEKISLHLLLISKVGRATEALIAKWKQWR